MRRTPSDPFARKPIAMLIGEMQGDERLHRVLGPLALTSLGVGATIGTGIYVLTGEVARHYAGPSLMLSFLLAAVGCGFAALCYSELASMVPVAGSAYTYAYATLGEMMGAMADVMSASLAPPRSRLRRSWPCVANRQR